MITLLSGILMLGILVFVHEFGHFCVAKLTGVKVLKFSLGFGPRLVSKRWGETEYMISAIPLGGYVQMLGEGGGEDGEEVELTEEERQRSFADKPLSTRVAIVAAGPLMNLALPFLLLPISYLVGVNVPAYLDGPPCAGYVEPASEAAQAGFKAGDCIVSVNGDKVLSWNGAFQTMVSHVGEPLDVLVSGTSGERHLKLSSDKDNLEDLDLGNLGLRPPRPAVIGALSPGYPAEAAGLQPGDRIVSIGGTPISSWYAVRNAILAGGGKPQRFVIDRHGQQLELTIAARQSDESPKDYVVGISPKQDVVFKRYGLGEAIKAGYKQATDIIGLTLVFIQKLFSGQVSAKNIGGPIMVFQVAGQAVQTGLATVLSILAFLSIQLGILNLLPIPILDGGHLFFYLFELVFRRPLSMRAREILQQLGLAMIVLLMVVAFYNDFMRLRVFQTLFGWFHGG